jgi:hypothetical protein
VVINKLWDEAAAHVLFAVKRTSEWSKILFSERNGFLGNTPSGIDLTEKYGEN